LIEIIGSVKKDETKKLLIKLLSNPYYEQFISLIIRKLGQWKDQKDILKMIRDFELYPDETVRETVKQLL
jgi:hypothetical protein